MKTSQFHSGYAVVLLLIFLFVFTSASFGQQFYNHADTAGASNAFPFSMNAGKCVNILIRAGEFGTVPSGQQITSIYIFMAATGTRTFTDLRILMAQDIIQNMTTAKFYDGPYDTVYYRASVSHSSVNNRWMNIVLDHPFVYDTSKSLIVFIGQCSSSGNSMTVRNKAFTGGRRVWSVGGCPFTPYNSMDGAIMGFGIDVTPVTNISVTGSEIPSDFSLDQNYPNPFNPETIIEFKVASAEFVNITVFDLLGRKIEVLVNRILNPGTYKLNFNAHNLTSGVYYYKMSTENFTETKRMILIR